MAHVNLAGAIDPTDLKHSWILTEPPLYPETTQALVSLGYPIYPEGLSGFEVHTEEDQTAATMLHRLIHARVALKSLGYMATILEPVVSTTEPTIDSVFGYIKQLSQSPKPAQLS